jgi:hypothetical protein
MGRAEVGTLVIKLNIENVGRLVGGILLNALGALENIAQLIGIMVGEPALGTLVGIELGLTVGFALGFAVGILVLGLTVGLEIGLIVGLALGLVVGILVLGLVVGLALGLVVGILVLGLVVGLELGLIVEILVRGLSVFILGNNVFFGIRFLLGLVVVTESSLLNGIAVGLRPFLFVGFGDRTES